MSKYANRSGHDMLGGMGAVPVLSVVIAMALCCVVCMFSAPLDPHGRRAIVEHATATAPSRVNLQAASSVLKRCSDGEDVSGALVSFEGEVDHAYPDQAWLSDSVIVENLGNRTPRVGEVFIGEGMVTGCTNGYLLVQASVRMAE